jgi:thiamine-phosphate pyrophosphorylase
MNFERPILCLVVDRSCSSLPIADAVESAVRAGVDWIQIRERELDSSALLALARDLKAAVERGSPGRDVRMIVNRRIDIALALGSNSVHLGFDALPVAQARELLGPSSWIGCSTHAASEVKVAADAGADYAHLAPIYTPLSKPAGRPALGQAAIAEAAAHGIPVLAQGGVEARHCADLVRSGAAGIAVTGAILMNSDPGAATAALRAALDTAIGSKQKTV